ncbi:response regulator [Luteibacter sp. dw_328]|uniref:response regulator n=1 Tax=Luteibacter sp. dw_328 TaxID=2719796 RepID=UPI001BD2F5A4|nr:response regulator [Luteibacter sp. dw_328]
MTATILIVEDESDLSAIMADYVTAAGYEAEVIADGSAALTRVMDRSPDLIVLDIMLPGLDGLSLCREVRTFSDVPIIMVTARVEEIDRLLGLETGADDYLCKPFSPRELVARIRAILRRHRTLDDDMRLVNIDEPKRTIRIRSQVLDLTPTEYSLFAAMAKRPGTIHSRAQLLDLVSRDNLDVTDRAIDSHIKNLRRKLSVLLPDVEIIHSVYGLGYRVEL